MIYCLTGHRPQDLPCGFNRLHQWKLEKLKSLANFLREKKPQVLISGMALGWDMWGAHTALKQGISVWAYVPCDGQDSLWNSDQKQQYNFLLTKCSKINVVSPGSYSAWKMHRRNEEMLKDADEVLSLWNPEKKYGGTYSTVAAALSMNKKVTNFYNGTPEVVSAYA